jgi:arylsulfatase
MLALHTPRPARRCHRYLLALLLCCGQFAGADAAPRPNFLVIVADDLGFSDLGAFGGEIATPNLDKLADSGLRMTNFHTAAACSPTRAMLMTGVDHHRAGIANMAELITPEQRGKPGYEGHLNDNVVTIAQLLRDAGYFTVMSGKWHLGLAARENPAQRGFDKSFALLPGGENHFARPAEYPPEMHDLIYSENGAPVPLAALPDDYYSSDYFADKLLGFLRDEAHTTAAAPRPFFAYLAFSAPHWPLQAPAAVIEKYRGRYDRGWEVLRQERLERQRRLGILTDNAALTPPGTMADWNALSAEAKQREARLMEIYAAMVDRMDTDIGRVLDYLRASHQLDNTVVIFLSDNGAEGGSASRQTKMVTGKDLPEAPYAALGSRNAIAWYGPSWAQAATAPYRLYKSNATEGGIRTPAIIRYPGFARQPGVDRSFLTVLDIAPTLLELAGANPPGPHYRDRAVEPMIGASLVPYLRGAAARIHPETAVTGWELFGQRALRQGDWKIAYVSKPNGSGQWALYDLAADPGERRDLAAEHPAKLKALIALWENYAAENHIIRSEQMISPYNWR